MWGWRWIVRNTYIYMHTYDICSLCTTTTLFCFICFCIFCEGIGGMILSNKWFVILGVWIPRSNPMVLFCILGLTWKPFQNGDASVFLWKHRHDYWHKTTTVWGQTFWFLMTLETSATGRLATNFQGKLVDDIRKRKGLPTDEKVVKDATKQRTVTRVLVLLYEWCTLWYGVAGWFFTLLTPCFCWIEVDGTDGM